MANVKTTPPVNPVPALVAGAEAAQSSLAIQYSRGFITAEDYASEACILWGTLNRQVTEIWSAEAQPEMDRILADYMAANP